MLPENLQNAQLGDLWLSSEDGDTVIALTTLDGWDGQTGTTRQVSQRVSAAGGVASRGFSTPLNVTVEGKIRGKDGAAVKAMIDRLNAAYAVPDMRLTVREDGADRFAVVSKQDTLLVDRKTPFYAEWSGQLSSEDWRKFAAPLQGVTGLPSTSGGLAVPFTIPFSIDAQTNTGQVSLNNPGNETGPVTLRIDGPVTGPIITHVASGLSLVFSSSLTLAAGEWLEVDMEAQTVLANGQASRQGWVVERGWSGFAPGDNTWAFSALNYSPDARLTVSATPAWL